MGYIEKVLGDKEQVVYRTHHHVVVLFRRIAVWLLAFIVLAGLGLTAITGDLGKAAGNNQRQIVGFITVCLAILPLAWLVRNLRRREQDVGVVRAIWQPALLAAALLAAGLLLVFKSDLWQVGIALAVASVYPLAETVRVFLDWFNQRYVITNRRVIEVKGIINKHVRDSALEKVNDVEMDQSFLGRILNMGTVEIITGSDVGVNLFHRIANPVRFKRAMLNAKEQLHIDVPALAMEGSAPVVVQPPVPMPAPAATPSPASGQIPDLIAELDDLRQKGILSEEEFQAKKKELLDRL